ncbi:MAG: radical SAM protein [Clostridia bacterium]|nr:radical SAM protein [Clostridia bacterium]
MKKHAIIPIFIPHKGCPNDCVFCNQKAITARIKDASAEDVSGIIEKHLTTLRGRNLETTEVAFFGGSFTGIPIEQQSEYLEVAQKYKRQGSIDKIHLSTRPDYIDDEILSNLKKYDVDIIELGVQSFDEEVLRLSNRGHDAAVVEKSCELIHRYGFSLGIQLMIGLPGDTAEKCIYSAGKAVSMKPDIARLYPTIVINDTELMRMFRRGEYEPLTTEAAVEITKQMYRILYEAGINIIRVGLKSTELINEDGVISGGTYHPAFRQLVEATIAREDMLELMQKAKIEKETKGKVIFSSCSRCVSNMAGNNGENKKWFRENYPGIRFSFFADEKIPDGKYVLKSFSEN